MVYKATSGNSGLSGTTMSLIEHDSELVDIVRQRAPRKRGRDINVVCPMAGKQFAFKQWEESLGKLPMDRAHVLVYDNSNRPAFHRMIEEFCQREFDSYTLVRDDNQKLTIDGLPNSSLGWQAIASRCDDVYAEIYTRWMDPRRPLCLNLEDDVGIPEDSWEKLSHTIRDEQVATVIGQCNDRRLFVHNGTLQSIAVNFEIQEKLGAQNVREVETIPVTPKDFGVEAVGGGHMGLWLTKTEAIQQVGITTRTDYIFGTDINWGYQLNRAGWKFAIDWSLKMDHFFQDSRGKLQSC
jgi:hypothetical protein